MISTWLKYNFKYSLKCWIFLPITFLRRVVFGKDKLPRRFFWDRWGFLSKDLLKLAVKRKSIWIVANSGGEVIQSRAFLDKIKELYPNDNLILSTESYDTFEYAQGFKSLDCVFFNPWDMPLICRKVLRAIKPKALIFIEHCYFPILANEAKRLKAKVLLFSGKIDSRFLNDNYLLKRSFALGFFRFLDMAGVKTEEDYDSLLSFGAERTKINILGDMRLDLSHISLTDKDKEKIRQELKFSKDDLVFIAGSVHNEEAGLIMEAFKLIRKKYNSMKLIIAPRWMRDIQFLEDLIHKNGYTCKKRSDKHYLGVYDVLIIDTFGELPSFYGIATVAFIASSIVPINTRRLGHNIFEALAHGTPTIFGPNMNSWHKVTSFLKEVWPGSEVNDSKGMAESTTEILNDRDLFNKLRQAALSLSSANNNIVNRYLEITKINFNN